MIVNWNEIFTEMAPYPLFNQRRMRLDSGLPGRVAFAIREIAPHRSVLMGSLENCRST